MSNSEAEDYQSLEENKPSSNKKGITYLVLFLMFIVSIIIVVYDWYHYSYGKSCISDSDCNTGYVCNVSNSCVDVKGNTQPLPTRSTAWRYFVNLCVGFMILCIGLGGLLLGYQIHQESQKISFLYWLVYIISIWAMVYAAVYKYYYEVNDKTSKIKDYFYKIAYWWLLVSIILLIIISCVAGGDSCLFFILFATMFGN